MSRTRPTPQRAAARALLTELDNAYPGRDRHGDGWIGDHDHETGRQKQRAPGPAAGQAQGGPAQRAHQPARP